MQLKSIFPFFVEPTTAAADTIIATETEFRGDIRSEQKIQINGAVIGNVIGPSGAEHCITVGAQGSVVGDILARHIEIAGKVKGNITATEMIVVRSTARISGEIQYASVSVERGAQLLGMMKTKSGPAAQAPEQTAQKQAKAD
jgi:cytoskeletal protein CcmA (bactofilin family)